MRILDLEDLLAAIEERTGRPVSEVISKQVLLEVSGCKEFASGAIHSAELESLFPLPGFQILWFSREVMKERSGRHHQRYFGEATCHIHEMKLYCFCL